MSKYPTIAVTVENFDESIDEDNAWILYRHAEFQHRDLLDGYTQTLCGHVVVEKKILYYDENIDCPQCIEIIKFAREKKLRYNPHVLTTP